MTEESLLTLTASTGEILSDAQNDMKTPLVKGERASDSWRGDSFRLIFTMNPSVFATQSHLPLTREAGLHF